MGFSGSLSSVEAETSQVAPATLPGLGNAGIPGASSREFRSMFQWTQVFHQPQQVLGL